MDYSPGPSFAGARTTFPALRHALDVAAPGCALEFGVSFGASVRIIAKEMPVIGFDSFEGLPEAWGPYPVGANAAPPPDVPGAQLVIGLFADTLPGFDFAAVQPITLVHLDADLYSSTATVLKHLGPHLRPGCCVVFDEWHGNAWYAEHEQKAWKEYVERTGVQWHVLGHDNEAWAIQLTGTETDG